jgi:hypothetical protein
VWFRNAADEYVMVDDGGEVLATVRYRRFTSWPQTIVTRQTTYEYRGIIRPRMVERAIGATVLSDDAGLLLPDGRRVEPRLLRLEKAGASTRPKIGPTALHAASRWRAELVDETGRVVVDLRWLPAIRRLNPRSCAKADLAPGLEPDADLAPLLVYAFIWFGLRTTPGGG